MLNLAAGTYNVSNVTITSSVSIVCTSSVFDAFSRSQHFLVLANASFTGCTFTNGNSTRGGSVTLGSGHALRLSGCTFLANNASQGGAVYSNSSSTLSIDACLFSNNTASVQGGAVYFKGFGNVSNTEFFANDASNGAAMFITENTVNL